ncbi:MAG: substrate-binding domain-containing protein [Burkholderiales bacterium]
MTLTGISSMATRGILAELAAAFGQRTGCRATFESVGGVDAAKRVEAGEPFDVVVLAGDAIDRLLAAGRIVAGTRVDVTTSGVAVAVRAGAPRPDIATEDAVRRAVVAARRIGYSTGPSGTELVKLFARWGMADAVAPRLVQARAGVPVAALVASGEADVGFQQYSEMMNAPGIAVVGMLPPAIAIVTTFSAGVCTASREPERARELLAFLASPETAEAKRRHGMQPA